MRPSATSPWSRRSTRPATSRRRSRPTPSWPTARPRSRTPGSRSASPRSTCTPTSTYRFLDDVLAELAALTPGEFLHVGGDEAHSTSHEDYLEFMARVQPLVAAQGKRLAGWEEIASAPLRAGSVVQYWNTGNERGHDLARAAVAQGAQLVMSPGDRVYLDMKYDAVDAARAGLGRARRGARQLRLGPGRRWSRPSARTRSSASRRPCGPRRCARCRTSRRCCSRGSARWPRSRGRRRRPRDWDDFRARVAAEAAGWNTAGVAYTPSPQIDWR